MLNIAVSSEEAFSYRERCLPKYQAEQIPRREARYKGRLQVLIYWLLLTSVWNLSRPVRFTV